MSTECKIIVNLKYNINTIMQKIHMMGISGSGMGGVATLASKMGYEVTGCDLKTGGHDKAHLDGIDLLVVSPAVLYQSSAEPELLIAKKKKIVMTWEEFVGKFLMKDKFVIAIAGTHGKSTTTAMIGKMMIDNGFDPTVLVGAKVSDWNGNSRYGKSKYFVIEADEFNDNFLHYSPNIIILNNIEFDHPDYFRDEKQLRASFISFTKRLIGKKTLITENDSENKRFNLKVFGEHNQKNANMAFALGEELGINGKKITESLENFNGIGRRMELVGKNVYDDYAHHPTAIKTTIAGLRNKYKNKRICAIVEPHGYKRTKALLNLYKGVFDAADSVIIGPIYKARDMVDKTITPDLIAKKSNHKNIFTANSVEQIMKIVKTEKKSGDLFVVMGAGNSDLWAREITKLVAVNSFKDITTLKVGGRIKYYFEVKDRDELVEKVKFAKQNNLPIFIIGSGSDIAASDRDYDGVVLKYVGDAITYKGNMATAEAGLEWDTLVGDTVNNNFQGIECLSGIPGTVGAAPIQNIGAYGQELADTFITLTAYDIKKEKFVKFNKEDCQFGYRKSIFKAEDYWQKFIICDITLKLNNAFDVNVKKIRLGTIKIREEKLENPNDVPNAGSFFMNPFVSLSEKIKFEKEYPEMKFYPVGDKFKVFAGFLIEEVGWKGKSLGPVKVSGKHALIITNPEGNGSFNDIKKLADAIINDVYKKFGIKLEPEVQYINT